MNYTFGCLIKSTNFVFSENCSEEIVKFLRVMESIVISRYDSPLGEMIIGSYSEAICICGWAGSERLAEVEHRVNRCLCTRMVGGQTAAIQNAISQLEEYFAGERKEFEVPIQFAGSEFQCRVWKELMAIPYGVTISYAEQARRMGNAKAVRAVASANAANAISIIVPCHRVIGGNHKLTGYAGGLEVKQKLLELETRASWNRQACR